MNKCFIVWKWEHLPKSAAYHRTHSVENVAEGAIVIEISEKISFDDLKHLFQKHFSDEKSDCLVLLHRSALLLEQKKALSNLWQHRPNIIFAQFAGGGDYIYYDPDKDTGLLNQRGKWAYNASFVRDNKPFSPILLNEKEELRYEYFKPIWRHYYHRYSARVYESRVALLNALDYRIVRGERGGFLSELEPDHTKALRATLSEMIHKYDPTVDTAIQKLQYFIKHKPLTSRPELRELNQHFIHLLESVKETIY